MKFCQRLQNVMVSQLKIPGLEEMNALDDSASGPDRRLRAEIRYRPVSDGKPVG